MVGKIVDVADGVTLIAGGPVGRRDLDAALARAPVLVAADGGADRALALGRMPAAVIGDFDSFSARGQARLAPEALHRIAEQETTDFDKALRSVAASFVIGLGCLGGRLDHALAVLNALVRQGGPVVLLGGPDVVFAAPPGRDLQLRMKAGERVSLFPLGPVRGESAGLEWPVAGLDFAPDGRIGTSNRATGSDVRLRFDRAGMIVILPRGRLDAALAALR